MSAAPTTSVLPQALPPSTTPPDAPTPSNVCTAIEPTASVTPPADTDSSPVASTESKRFTAIRKVVEVQEMDMGELYETYGLSAVLHALDSAEVNPIVTHGEPHVCMRS